MIRINLLTVKRRKPIQIPFALIFALVGLVAVGFGYYVGQQAIPGLVNVEEKEKELKDTQARITKAKSIETEINKYSREKREIEERIQRLQQLSGSSLLPWTRVFSDVTSVVPKSTVWITNMRIDTDRRVQLTAYACNENGKEEPKDGSGQLTKGIQDFIGNLNNSENFSEIFLASASKNKFEQRDVWRFEISCRLRRELSDGGDSYE